MRPGLWPPAGPLWRGPPRCGRRLLRLRPVLGVEDHQQLALGQQQAQVDRPGFRLRRPRREQHHPEERRRVGRQHLPEGVRVVPLQQDQHLQPVRRIVEPGQLPDQVADHLGLPVRGHQHGVRRQFLVRRRVVGLGAGSPHPGHRDHGVQQAVRRRQCGERHEGHQRRERQHPQGDDPDHRRRHQLPPGEPALRGQLRMGSGEPVGHQLGRLRRPLDQQSVLHLGRRVPQCLDRLNSLYVDKIRHDPPPVTHRRIPARRLSRAGRTGQAVRAVRGGPYRTPYFVRRGARHNPGPGCDGGWGENGKGARFRRSEQV
ncbi:hypothetical protein CFP65_3119 [Kitasatospora sp. MMS16-BH015]|nr:hypothetical protein CFP65_3119 [Kitasatospora sp. MMS16-BH015]